MDLNSIDAILTPRRRDDLPPLSRGDAWLAGGTWLFSEPQPRLRRLVDLAGLDWPPLQVTPQGLSIAATCTVATVAGFEPPPAWTAAGLIGQCCRSFLASFKIWNTATVGGNICMALPAGPMISLAVALESTCIIWSGDGSERFVPALDFIEGPQRPALRPGELLRSIEIPREALTRRTVFRRMALSPLGRSSALLIGTFAASGAFALTVTAATRRPVRLGFSAIPRQDELNARVAADIPPSLYYDDIHGTPDWRRHITFEFAEEIRCALAEGAA